VGPEDLTEEHREKSPRLFRNVTKWFPFLSGYVWTSVIYGTGHQSRNDTLIAYLFVCSKPTNMLSISIWLVIVGIRACSSQWRVTEG